MARDGAAQRGNVLVFYAVLLAYALYNFADGRVMHMADFGEKVVLDLKIEAANKPAYDFTVHGKVRGGAELVDGPCVFDFHFTIHMCGIYKLGVVDHVCQLEYKRHGEAHCGIGDEVAGQRRTNTGHVNGNGQVKHDVKHFRGPKDNMLLHGEMLHGRAVDVFFEVFLEIGEQCPQHRRNGVQGHHVNVLVLVRRFPGL